MIRAIGRRVRDWRAGAEHRTAKDDRFFDVPHAIELRSDTFASGESMPPSKLSPPLRWSGVPPEARCLVLVVEDVDVPLLRPFVHAIAYEIDPDTTSLDAAGLVESRTALGYNGLGRLGYAAPTPLPGHGPHRYVFTLLAVDFVPRFDQPPTKHRLLDAVGGHVIALGELIGTAER